MSNACYFLLVNIFFRFRLRWDRRLQPDAGWTTIRRNHVCNGERQTVSGLGVTVSTRTFLQSR